MLYGVLEVAAVTAQLTQYISRFWIFWLGILVLLLRSFKNHFGLQIF
jgi:hypothetical protein